MAELSQTSFFTDANLVALYKLENVNDSKGSFTLTNNGSIAFNAAKYNNGADLGASNSSKYLNIASDLVAADSPATFAFWAKLQTEIGSGTYKLFSHVSDTNIAGGRYIDFNYDYNGGTRRLSVDVSGNALVSNITLGTTDFTHFCLVKRASDTELYINGVSVATSTPGSTNGGAQKKFLIGASVAPSQFASAIFDDFAVFSRGLSSAEVLALYQGLVTPKGGFMAFF